MYKYRLRYTANRNVSGLCHLDILDSTLTWKTRHTVTSDLHVTLFGVHAQASLKFSKAVSTTIQHKVGPQSEVDVPQGGLA